MEAPSPAFKAEFTAESARLLSTVLKYLSKIDSVLLVEITQAEVRNV